MQRAVFFCRGHAQSRLTRQLFSTPTSCGFVRLALTRKSSRFASGPSKCIRTRIRALMGIFMSLVGARPGQGMQRKGSPLRRKQTGCNPYSPWSNVRYRHTRLPPVRLGRDLDAIRYLDRFQTIHPEARRRITLATPQARQPPMRETGKVEEAQQYLRWPHDTLRSLALRRFLLSPNLYRAVQTVSGRLAPSGPPRSRRLGTQILGYQRLLPCVANLPVSHRRMRRV